MTKDMTRKQFMAALERHGFTYDGWWVWSNDHKRGHGVIYDPKTMRPRFRATLAKAIQAEREAAV